MKKMLKELLEAKYQNFYINDDGVICGIVSPREIWKLNQEYIMALKTRYEKTIKTCGGSNFDGFRKATVQAERVLKRLNAAIKKLEVK
jgi:hypothetical protein